MNVTIKEVARYAGVSIATVSRVINNADNVLPETKSAVMNAIEALHYTPNKVAQSLKSKASKNIGIVVNDLSNEFFIEIVKTIEHAFSPAGYNILVSNYYDNPELEKRLIQTMYEHQVDALISCPSGHNDLFLKSLSDSGLPVLLVDRRSNHYDFPTFYVDKRKGMHALLDHLFSLGHRKIQFLSGPRELSTTYDKYMGIQDYIYNQGLDPNSITTIFDSFRTEFGSSVVDRHMLEPDDTTAFISGGIAITEGFLTRCKECRLLIPDEFSLVTFDRFPTHRLVEPRITNIESRGAELAQNMADFMLEIFRNPSRKFDRAYTFILEPQLTVGTSTSAPKLPPPALCAAQYE